MRARCIGAACLLILLVIATAYGAVDSFKHDPKSSGKVNKVYWNFTTDASGDTTSESFYVWGTILNVKYTFVDADTGTDVYLHPVGSTTIDFLQGQFTNVGTSSFMRVPLVEDSDGSKVAPPMVAEWVYIRIDEGGNAKSGTVEILWK